MDARTSATAIIGDRPHPLEAGRLLAELGAPEHVVLAGLLHDAVEDGDATPGELRDRFGPGVAGLVAVLTEDPSIEDWRDRKAALRAQVAQGPPEAALVFAADKLSKVREGGLTPERREHHEASLRVLRDRLGDGHPLVRRLAAELSPAAGATSR